MTEFETIAAAAGRLAQHADSTRDHELRKTLAEISRSSANGAGAGRKSEPQPQTERPKK